MPFIDQLGQQAAQEATGAVLGLALGGINDQRQVHQQGRLQALQIRGQKEMSDYNYAKQLQMWKDTSYGAQVEQMNKAGINPALLYGMSGGGGQTTGSGSGGNVTGAEAPKGGHEIPDIMGIQNQAAQLQLINSQRKNLDADTADKLSRIPKTGSEKTKIDTETGNLQIEGKYKQLQLSIANATQEEAIQKLTAEASKAMIEVNREETQLGLDRATVMDKAATIKAELMRIGIENALTKAQTAATQQGIKLSQAEIQKMAQDISQGWKKIDNETKNLDRQERQLELERWVKEQEQRNPGIWNLIGGTIKQLSEYLPGSNPVKAPETHRNSPRNHR